MSELTAESKALLKRMTRSMAWISREPGRPDEYFPVRKRDLIDDLRAIEAAATERQAAADCKDAIAALREWRSALIAYKDARWARVQCGHTFDCPEAVGVDNAWNNLMDVFLANNPEPHHDDVPEFPPIETEGEPDPEWDLDPATFISPRAKTNPDVPSVATVEGEEG